MPLAADQVADLAADQDERRRDQRLERDRRLDAADGRVRGRGRRPRSTRSSARCRHEHEHRHREEQGEPLIERCLFRKIGGRSVGHRVASETRLAEVRLTSCSSSRCGRSTSMRRWLGGWEPRWVGRGCCLPRVTLLSPTLQRKRAWWNPSWRLPGQPRRRSTRCCAGAREVDVVARLAEPLNVTRTSCPSLGPRARVPEPPRIPTAMSRRHRYGWSSSGRPRDGRCLPAARRFRFQTIIRLRMVHAIPSLVAGDDSARRTWRVGVEEVANR